MGRKINKKILEDFNSTYESKLTPQDIISKTNYFNEPVDENYYSYKKFKLKLKKAKIKNKSRLTFLSIVIEFYIIKLRKL